MKKTFLSLSLLGLLSSVAFATAIDNGNSQPGVAQEPGSALSCSPAGPVFVPANSGDALGGGRWLDIENAVGGCNRLEVGVNSVYGNTEPTPTGNGVVIAISQPSGGQADFYVLWRGFGPINLTNGIKVNAGTDVGAPRFRFLVYDSAASPTTSILSALTGTLLAQTDWQTIATSLTSSGALTSYSLPFIGGIAPSGVGAIVMEVDGATNNSDIEIDLIADIPEPGTMVLAGAALLAVAGLRRRSA